MVDYEIGYAGPIPEGAVGGDGPLVALDGGIDVGFDEKAVGGVEVVV